MTCQGCGAPIHQPRASGRRRKWCSESCRKRHSYSGTCVDCGAPTAYSGQAHPSPRCVACGSAKAGADKKVWTREAILAAFGQWAEEHGGRPPRTFDWNPTVARHHNVTPPPGHWPHFNTVLREFGSWRAGVVAAGLTPNPRERHVSGLSAACCKTPGNQSDPATVGAARGHGNQEGPS